MRFVIIFIAIYLLPIAFISCQEKENNSFEQINEKKVVNSENDLALKSQRRQLKEFYNDEISNSRRNALTDAIEICNPAIVGINVTEVRQVVYRDPFSSDPFFRYFFGDRGGSRTREYEVQGLGSGFIISPDGYILTNHHVAGSASKIVVTMTNGERFDAEIIGSDMVSDVALLKIKGRNLPFLKLGNSDDLIIGEWVIAFGNPFGLFDKNSKPTVTVGVVSNNDINFVHQDRPLNRIYRSMIQTDAAISSGNSGGPLVNSLGEVIGMNTMIYSTSQGREGAGSIGIGFAIPINRVKYIVELLKKHGKLDREYYTGMDIRVIDEYIAKYLKLDVAEGVVVSELLRNSPAMNAGFELGDVVVDIDGSKIMTVEDYLIATGDAVTGQTLNFTVLRNGKPKNIKLKLEPRRR